jgi:hypothetical protein
VLSNVEPRRHAEGIEVLNKTSREICEALLSSSSLNLRVEALVKLVLDLLMEVEAVREVLVRAVEETRGAPAQCGCDVPCPGEFPGKAGYQRTYLDTAYLTHNAAGPTSGFEKLLARFYPEDTTANGRRWREVLMLERLGFSKEEIERFKDAATEAKWFT